MPTMPALDLTELLKGVPRGAWVAISTENEKVIAFGAELRAVLDEAKKQGENEPLITRVPETAAAMIL